MIILKNLVSAFQLLFFVISAYLCVAFVFLFQDVSTVMIFVLFFGTIFFTQFYIAHKPFLQQDVAFFTVLIVSIICLFFCQVHICTMHVCIPQKGDYEAVYTATKELSSYGHFTDSVRYYLLYEHQLFTTVVLGTLNRIFAMIGSETPVQILWTSCCICVLTSIGVACTALASKLLFGVQKAYLALLLMMGYLCYYTCNIYLYPHALSVGFMGVGLLCVSVALTKAKTRWQVILSFFSVGVSFAFMYLVEGIFLLGVIALFIFLLFHFLDDIKKMLLCVVCVALALGCTISMVHIAYEKADVFNGAYSENQKLPYEHWLMMGLSEKGIYVEEDYQASVALPDTSTRQEYARKEIIKRLHNRTPVELLSLLHAKEMRNFIGAPYGANIFGKIDGSLVCAHRAILILGVLLCALAHLKKKKSDAVFFFSIWFVGIFLFFALWESSAIYLFSSVPILVMIASDGLARGCLYISNNSFIANWKGLSRLKK